MEETAALKKQQQDIMAENKEKEIETRKVYVQIYNICIHACVIVYHGQHVYLCMYISENIQARARGGELD